jgi:hypothetical protein
MFMFLRFVIGTIFLSTFAGCPTSEPVQFSACSFEGERRAISYGLYGSMPKYTQGALRNAELVQKIYPGWKAVYYVDTKTVPQEIITGLEERGAMVIKDAPHSGTMFARFLIADHPDFDRFIIRDVDSRLDKREKAAVEEWIKSCRPMHNMRDHVEHDVSVLGGLWGGTKGFLHGQKMVDLVERWNNRAHWGQDQDFLAGVVLPIVGIDNMLSHDSYHCKKYPNSVPFPTRRPDRIQKDFVGQIYLPDQLADGQWIEKPVASSGPSPSQNCVTAY